MKKLTTMCALLFLSQIAFSQQTTTDKKEINKVVKTFMECLVKKDSSTFYTLFHKDPVVWIGVFKDKTHEDIMKKSSHKENYFGGSYKGFFRSISSVASVEQKFYNVDIHEDGSNAFCNIRL